MFAVISRADGDALPEKTDANNRQTVTFCDSYNIPPRREKSCSVIFPPIGRSNGEEAVRGIRIGFRSQFHRRVHFIISAIRSNESVFHISLNSGNPIMKSVRFPRMVSSDHMRSRTQFELYRSRQTTANRKSGMAKAAGSLWNPLRGALFFYFYEGCAGRASAFK